MTPIGQLERDTQNRVVMLLENQLGWEKPTNLEPLRGRGGVLFGLGEAQRW
ncbi:MAG: hypothetical protein IPN20_24510 [Haliscomenobacter sp.]|nr:hypothetical protein [Haliscomenobacter sp.]